MFLRKASYQEGGNTTEILQYCIGFSVFQMLCVVTTEITVEILRKKTLANQISSLKPYQLPALFNTASCKNNVNNVKK